MQYGRYQIISVLGRGSMGVVYKAHDPQIDRLVALKVLREDRVTSDDFVRRFLKEAMAVGRLSHPGIVTVYDVGQDHDSIYIAMEFLQGTPLDELMDRGKFTLEEIVDIGIQTAGALHYAHQHGIVHRDIKPPNIIYSPEGAIRVTDFGIARIEDPDGHQMTQAGEILGTPLYMSPEQVMGQPLDGRSDIYSLGVILYQLTTGQRPFQGSTLAAIFRAITQDSPEAPHIVDPTVPVPLSNLIMRLLDKDPAKRFSSGEELIGALRTSLQVQPSGRDKPPLQPAKKEPAGLTTSIKILIPSILLLLVCVGIGSFYYFRQPPAPSKEPAVGQQKPITFSTGGQLGTEPPDSSANLHQPLKEDLPTDNAASVTPPATQHLPQSPGSVKIPPTHIQKQPPPQTLSSLTPEDKKKIPPTGKQTLLKMDSRPPGASLYIDGALVGKTPVRLAVVAGKHEVKLKLDKHLGWEAQLDLSKGGEIPLSVQLLPERTAKP